ncbi:MAG TPA: DUF6062 family protein [Candidatus Acidoferrales bacterium]|nr:DUF6062 family protein [Candidatus Acidoferrales bacterium]
MDKSYSYFKLLSAFKRDGCPICRLVVEIGRQYLDQLFYESVLDVPTRLKLIESFGFCNWHTWQVPSLPPICSPEAGFSIFASDLLRKLALVTEDALKRAREKKTLRSFFRKIRLRFSDALKRAPCPACLYVSEFEAYYLQDLLDFIRDRELLAAYESSQGICWPHFRALETRRAKHPNLPFLAELQQKKAHALRETLEEFIRKLDHRFQRELTVEERGAWKVAMEFLAGKPGVFTNEMRHDLLKHGTEAEASDEIHTADLAWDRPTLREWLDSAKATKQLALYARRALPAELLEFLEDLASSRARPQVEIVLEDIEDIPQLRRLHAAGFSLFYGLALPPQPIIFADRERAYALETNGPAGGSTLKPLKNPDDLHAKLLWRRFGTAVSLSGRVKEKDLKSRLLRLTIDGERELWCRVQDSIATAGVEPGAAVEIFGWEKWLTRVVEVLEIRALRA